MAKTTISLAAGCMNELGRSFFGFLQAFNKFLIKGVQYEKLVDEMPTEVA
jgi:hypothetical protein